MAEYGSASEDQVFSNVVRNGTVVNRRNGAGGPEIQVAYTDKNVISDWMPYGQNLGSAGMAFHFCPRIGDNVTTLHNPTGIEQAIAICTNATDNNQTFIPNSLDAIAMSGEDGSYFEHEPNTGTTTMAGIRNLHIKTTGDAVIYIDGNEMRQIGGAITEQVGATITITAGGVITLNAPTFVINAPTITLNGDTTVTKSLTVKGFTDLQGGGQANPHMLNEDGSSVVSLK